ncbi:hypothetical protein GCM10011578_095670 [Streptomyces fuscichromogenes]|uniref:Uncharacterized protein n=1 Tax=Streptomyces fuscichromogenes TaxID=1324013 RepID=A0A918CXA8_9ACTN|nr:hypothetical protein GCM10011578_095670 [Streptomyces fuscichromogenes]
MVLLAVCPSGLLAPLGAPRARLARAVGELPSSRLSGWRPYGDHVTVEGDAPAGEAVSYGPQIGECEVAAPAEYARLSDVRDVQGPGRPSDVGSCFVRANAVDVMRHVACPNAVVGGGGFRADVVVHK